MPRPGNRALRLAAICGAAPLVAGVTIFLLWVTTRSSWLEVAGMGTILAGIVFVAVGTVALVHHSRAAVEVRGSRLPGGRAVIACTLLLLANFPVATGLVVAAVAVETRYVVEVHNASQTPLEDVRIVGGGCDESLGRLDPGERARVSFYVRNEGALEVHAVRGTVVVAETIEGYVTKNLGGRAWVTFGDDGVVTRTDDG